MKKAAHTTKSSTTNELTRQFRKKKVLDTASQLQRLVCSRSLSAYIREAWPILNPSTSYIPNWHIDLISEYLQACSIRQILRLIINLPPKGTKSTIVSGMWPTWCWGPQNQPGTRWMFASYSEKVSTRDSLARRTLLTAPWYTGHWGSRVRLIADQNQKTIFQNTARGHMLATTMGGQGTGLGGQYLVIDDPHDTEKIISEKERQRGLHNFDNKLYTRLDDRKTGVIVIIMQRLHTKDLTGHLLDGPDGARWEHLSVPMEAPADKFYIFPVSKKEYSRAEGELLNPTREGPAELEEHKARLGSYGYASQFQQTPLPAGGGVFKLHWFKLWPKQDSLGNEHSPELPQFEQTVQSWDTAIKSNETNSYSVCTTWGVCNFGYFLLDVWRKHVEFPEMIHAMNDLAGLWHPQAILVENKSSGQSAIQELRHSTLPVIAIDVDTDKTARARAAAPKAESGKIWIIRDAPWARLYLDELCNFPKSAFDDQVDSTSQFINWIHLSSSGLTAFYYKELEKDRLDKIRRGEPILRAGVYVYFCAKAGCGKELIVDQPFVLSRGLKFCCQDHAW